MLIDAVAGSGKTATLIEILRLIPATQTAIFLAFNKSAAVEVERRATAVGLARPGVQFKTLNALGHSAVVDRFGRVKLDSDVIDNLLRDRLSYDARDAKTGKPIREPTDEYFRVRTCVKSLVSAAKSQGLVPDGIAGSTCLLADTPANWAALCDQFSIDPPGGDDDLLARSIEIARLVLIARLRDCSVIDFNDQLYATVVLGLPLRRFDWVLVDESQDLNVVQRRMIGGAIKRGGRLIAVGDPYQAIYQFRGASSASMAEIARDYDGVTLPLSVTYRCCTSVVDAARELVPHLLARDGAPAGTITYQPKIDDVQWRPDDLVLCRSNAPLVRLAYRLIRQRVPCRVAGREIGQGLRATIRDLGPSSVADLATRLDQWEASERLRLTDRRASPDRLQAHADKCDCLRVFIEACDELSQIDAQITALFDDDTVGRLTLSSIHKAKGGEADRVFILDPHRMPSRWARTPEQKQSERNIIYVALTRARFNLVYISIDPANPIVVPRARAATTQARAPRLPKDPEAEEEEIKKGPLRGPLSSLRAPFRAERKTAGVVAYPPVISVQRAQATPAHMNSAGDRWRAQHLICRVISPVICRCSKRGDEVDCRFSSGKHAPRLTERSHRSTVDKHQEQPNAHHH